MKTGKQQVAAYIAAAPAEARPMLRQLRQIIRTTAPKAEERISYRVRHAYPGDPDQKARQGTNEGDRGGTGLKRTSVHPFGPPP